MLAARLVCLALLSLVNSSHEGQIPGQALAPVLQPYTACRLAGGPDVVEVAPLQAKPMTRQVDTLQGPRQIEMLGGVRVMFAYPVTDFYANLKAEELPAAKYAIEKADLISGEDKLIASSDDVSRNYKLKARLHGFEIYGLDRTRLEGGVLGIYLLFDDATHVVTTIYFLNADPSRRKFDSLGSYASLRDSFLERFTTCIHTAD